MKLQPCQNMTSSNISYLARPIPWQQGYCYEEEGNFFKNLDMFVPNLNISLKCLRFT